MSLNIWIQGLSRSSRLKKVVTSGHTLPRIVKRSSLWTFLVRISFGDQTEQRLSGPMLGRIYIKCFYSTTTQANMMQTWMSRVLIRKIDIGLEQHLGGHLMVQTQSSFSHKQWFTPLLSVFSSSAPKHSSRKWKKSKGKVSRNKKRMNLAVAFESGHQRESKLSALHLFLEFGDASEN
jgi:hypothetical protein